MNVFDAIAQRRSCKRFAVGVDLPRADLDKIVRAGMLAPTSFNAQHWRFVRVSDHMVRQQIFNAAMGQEQVKDASELFVITGDVNAWDRSPQRYWKNCDASLAKSIVGSLRGFYQGRPLLQEQEAVRSGALAAQNMMLAATALGYHSCPMIGFDADKVAKAIQLPDDHIIVMLLALGKAVASPSPRGGQLGLSDVLLENQFEDV